MKTLKKLFEDGLLKKITPSKSAAIKSISVAENYVDQAKKSMKVGAYDAAMLAAYAGMFHAGRAILFINGIKEKSHWAMIEYLKMEHSDRLGIGMLNSLDHYRLFRHSTAYGLGDRTTKKDVEGAIEFADELLGTMGELIK